MHIPNHMLNGTICPVTAGMSAAALGAAVLWIKNSKQKPGGLNFAALSALVFSAQMLNFPVQHGTSGHLIGGVLLASLLGIPAGVLAMAMILTIQCLVFSDGGRTVLGANIFNMAILGAGVGGFLYQKFEKVWRDKTHGRFLALSLASWLSVLLAAFACSLELLASNPLKPGAVFFDMMTTHARIGIGEVLMTAALFFLLNLSRSASKQKTSFAAAAGAFIGAVMLSPFASPLPDGLEWAAEKYQMLHTQSPAFLSPMNDYSIRFISNSSFSTALAGLFGIIITAFCGFLLTKLFSGKISRA